MNCKTLFIMLIMLSTTERENEDLATIDAVKEYKISKLFLSLVDVNHNNLSARLQTSSVRRISQSNGQN